MATEPERFLSHSRASLYPSTWPLDHGDTARSKFVLHGGLPKDVRAEDIKITRNDSLKVTAWIYTGGEDSKYVYVMNGDRDSGYFVSKLDAVSLALLQQFRIHKAWYPGGLLMHSNGHVYCVHSNILFAFWNGDLSACTQRVLPTALNGNAVQTNGMLVTQDGYLVIKQWSWTSRELLFSAAHPDGQKMWFAAVAVSCALVHLLLRPGGALQSLLIGAVVGSVLWVAFFTSVPMRQTGAFNPLRFLADGLLSSNGGGGELKIVDPITLQVVASMDLPERCSFARMALSKVTNSDGDSEDAIVLLGDCNVHQVRWRPRTSKLYFIPDWSRSYRHDGDGSFPGTGPAVYGGMTYFTNNTFPVLLSQQSYGLFACSLHLIDKEEITVSKHYVPSEEVRFPPSSTLAHYLSRGRACPPLEKVRCNASAKDGFMVWSVAIHPEGDGHVLVWDMAGASVQARDLKDVSKLHWELKGVRQTDCIVSLPAQGHLYMADLDGGPEHTKDWLHAVTTGKYKHVSKFFLIVDAASGEVLLRKEFTRGITPSLMVPGAHNDVFVGTPDGVARLYV